MNSKSADFCLSLDEYNKNYILGCVVFCCCCFFLLLLFVVVFFCLFVVVFLLFFSRTPPPEFNSNGLNAFGGQLQALVICGYTI